MLLGIAKVRDTSRGSSRSLRRKPNVLRVAPASSRSSGRLLLPIVGTVIVGTAVVGRIVRWFRALQAKICCPTVNFFLAAAAPKLNTNPKDWRRSPSVSRHNQDLLRASRVAEAAEVSPRPSVLLANRLRLRVPMN